MNAPDLGASAGAIRPEPPHVTDRQPDPREKRDDLVTAWLNGDLMPAGDDE